MSVCSTSNSYAGMSKILLAKNKATHSTFRKAAMRGVIFLLSAASTSAPAWTSSWTTSRCPPFAASHSGVFPFLFRTSMWAPLQNQTLSIKNLHLGKRKHSDPKKWDKLNHVVKVRHTEPLPFTNPSQGIWEYYCRLGKWSWNTYFSWGCSLANTVPADEELTELVVPFVCCNG